MNYITMNLELEAKIVVLTIMTPIGPATFALRKFFPAQLKKVLESFKPVIGCNWGTAIEVLLGRVDNRVSQNAPKCILASDIAHMAVSIPQEPPKKIHEF